MAVIGAGVEEVDVVVVVMTLEVVWDGMVVVVMVLVVVVLVLEMAVLDSVGQEVIMTVEMVVV